VGAIESLEKAFQELELNRDSLGHLKERYDELETNLDRMDFDFSRNEHIFMNQLEEFLRGMSNPLPFSGVPPYVPKPTVIPNIPPLLMEYYSRVGDIGVLEDRIRDISQDFELNTKYADYNTILGELNQFHQRWEDLRHQLHVARTEAEELLRRCYDHGLEPDPEAIA